VTTALANSLLPLAHCTVVVVWQQAVSGFSKLLPLAHCTEVVAWQQAVSGFSKLESRGSEGATIVIN
jgi:hypothetical protein